MREAPCNSLEIDRTAEPENPRTTELAEDSLAAHVPTPEHRAPRSREDHILAIVKKYEGHPLAHRALQSYRREDAPPLHPPEDPEDLLGRYFQEAGQYRLLEAAEERDLFSHIEGGLVAFQEADGLDALDDLQESALIDLTSAYKIIYSTNLRLVISIADKYSGMPFLDIIQEGNIGLSKAITHFDSSRKLKFSTLATPWIKGAIVRALAKKSRLIPIPEEHHNKWVTMGHKSRGLAQQLGREPTPEEIAPVMRMTPAEVEDLQLVGAENLPSLNQPIGDDIEFGDLIPDARDVAGRALEAFSDKAEVGELLPKAKLNERQKLVISLRFQLYIKDLSELQIGQQNYDAIFQDAFLQDKSPTYESIGRILGVTVTRVRQIERIALNKMARAQNKS